MKSLPTRHRLANDAALFLKERIQNGLIHDVLPGEIFLKDSLGVSRETLRKALEMLCEEGWIEPAVKGRARRVKSPGKGREAAVTDLLPVTFLVDYETWGQRRSIDMKGIENQLLLQGRELNYLQTSILRSHNPTQRLKKLVASHPSAAWIIRLGTPEVQRWFEEQGIPAMVYGDLAQGVNLPHVTFDWGAATFHAGIQLVRRGHRHIALMIPSLKSPAYPVIRKNLENALNTVGGGLIANCLGVPSPEMVAENLEKIFLKKERPTALVLTRASSVISCYSWLLARGISVPRDLSIISLPNETWFAGFIPPICHYRPDNGRTSHAIAAQVMDLVNSGSVAHPSVSVPLEYMGGGTIEPPLPPTGH